MKKVADDGNVTPLINKPVFVGDLVVRFISPEKAEVVEVDCRRELLTTFNSCTCCTFRFNYRRNPEFQCRHIKALYQAASGLFAAES